MRDLSDVEDDRLKHTLHGGNLRWTVNSNADSKLSPEEIHRIIQDGDVHIHRKRRHVIECREERLQGEKQRVASVLECCHKGDVDINEDPV